MIGDGVTDMQAKPPADLFIGFGGVITREAVRTGADLFVTDFQAIEDLLDRWKKVTIVFIKEAIEMLLLMMLYTVYTLILWGS